MRVYIVKDTHNIIAGFKQKEDALLFQEGYASHCFVYCILIDQVPDRVLSLSIPLSIYEQSQNPIELVVQPIQVPEHHHQLSDQIQMLQGL